MACDVTREELFYIMRAEREDSEAGRKHLTKKCPRCGKNMVLKPLQNGARNIRCVGEACINVDLRGL